MPTPGLGHVFIVGSMNIDITARSERLPRPGETVLGVNHSVRCGGKGANQAVAAARCGASARMVGCVGDDHWGGTILAALRDEGVDTTGVRVVATDSGLALITLDSDGENAIVVSPAANAQCSEQVVEAGLTTLTAGDVVVAQGEIPAEAIVEAAHTARRRGARFVLNLAPVLTLPQSMPRPDVLIVNEHEAHELAGHTSSSPESAIRALSARAETVVLTLGARGALMLSGTHVIVEEAIQPRQVVDTTGAGDAFVGGFATALAHGAATDEALRWATAAGALAVEGPGAQGGNLTVEALQQHLTRTDPIGVPR